MFLHKLHKMREGYDNLTLGCSHQKGETTYHLGEPRIANTVGLQSRHKHPNLTGQETRPGRRFC